jgi:hypothetical protein
MGHRFFFPTWPKEKECVSDGMICCYDSCDCDPANLALCIRGEETCLCFDCKFCCASGDTPFPVGVVKEADYICKLGLHFFTCGLKNPDMKKLCMIDCRCLCYQWAGQLPFGGKGAALALPPSHFPPSHTLLSHFE